MTQWLGGRGAEAIKSLDRLATRPFIVLLTVWHLSLSRLFGQRCRFSPSCSCYAVEALKKHGLVKGAYFTILRVIRCNPLCQGGEDPVP